MTGFDRRAFLRGSAAAGLAGGALVGLEATAESAAQRERRRSVPFDGPHQAGIITPAGGQATLVALDAIAPNRATLLEALAAVSSRARELTAGYSFGQAERDDPPPDSGMVGTTVTPDALTVTIAFGASLFDDRFGLQAMRPAGLTAMPRFPGDDIDENRAHGDVLLTLDADQRDTVLHAMREILRPVRGALTVRWTLDGFLGAQRGPTARNARRNLFGFRDGTSNPTGTERDALLWLPADAGWAAGGTFQVVRVIRQWVEFWDRVGLREQENMIGRFRDSGAPLGGTSEFQNPRYDQDPKGDRIPLDAHIRLANPRTRETEPHRILRRGFNYHRGVDAAGQLDDGLIFNAFNRSIQDQFETIQKRLAGEPMTDYITPVGGGYYFAPRSATGPTDWVGSGLTS